MKAVLLIFCCLIFDGLKAQVGLSEINSIEDSLINLSKIMIKNNDAEKRTRASYQFHKELKSVLKSPASLNYAFDSLTLISKISSPDKRIRIFTSN